MKRKLFICNFTNLPQYSKTPASVSRTHCIQQHPWLLITKYTALLSSENSAKPLKSSRKVSDLRRRSEKLTFFRFFQQQIDNVIVDESYMSFTLHIGQIFMLDASVWLTTGFLMVSGVAGYDCTIYTCWTIEITLLNSQ